MGSVKYNDIIVQKFGGTSLSSLENIDRAVAKIIAALEKGFRPVAIVSAMGRAGSPYATDTLLNALREASPGAAAREKDLLMSCGEIISTVFITSILRERGFPAVAMTGGQAGIITDKDYGQAKILRVKPDKVREALAEGIIPVVAGFQGRTPEGDVTTLGRGGSDITASVIAVALHASLLEIYTDVDGVLTADPQKVPDARVLPEVSYEEIFELAAQGAKVIHPKAAEIAGKRNLPIKILPTFSDKPGTLIRPKSRYSCCPERIVTGITSKNNKVYVEMQSRDGYGSHCNLQTLRALYENNIDIDFLSLQPSSLSFIIGKEFIDRMDEIFSEKYEYNYVNGFCKVTIIGSELFCGYAILSDALAALQKENIAIQEVRDTQSTVSLLLKESDEEDALKTLHKKFKLEEVVL